jgi:hypothetical protein
VTVGEPTEYLPLFDGDTPSPEYDGDTHIPEVGDKRPTFEGTVCGYSVWVQCLGTVCEYSV